MKETHVVRPFIFSLDSILCRLTQILPAASTIISTSSVCYSTPIILLRFFHSISRFLPSGHSIHPSIFPGQIQLNAIIRSKQWSWALSLICPDCQMTSWLAVPETTMVGSPDMFVRAGAMINLTCIISRAPEPPSFVFWYHNERMIYYDLQNAMITSGKGSISLSKNPLKADSVVSRLVIHSAKLNDSGNYSCHFVGANNEPAHIYVHVLQGNNSSLRNLIPCFHPPAWHTVTLSLKFDHKKRRRGERIEIWRLSPHFPPALIALHPDTQIYTRSRHG